MSAPPPSSATPPCSGCGLLETASRETPADGHYSLPTSSRLETPGMVKDFSRVQSPPYTVWVPGVSVKVHSVGCAPHYLMILSLEPGLEVGVVLEPASELSCILPRPTATPRPLPRATQPLPLPRPTAGT